MRNIIKKFIGLTIGLIIFLGALNVHAFEWKIEMIDPAGNFVNATMTGKIERGDFAKFKLFLKMLEMNEQTVNNLILNSNGGDVIEAMRIGELVRKNFIPTQAPLMSQDDCDCASACLLIWAAGVHRMGNKVGLHRPYFDKEYFKGLSAPEAKKKYAALTEEVRSYLKKMDVPESVINTVFSTSSDDIVYLDSATANAMEWVPFFEEWLSANCTVFTFEDIEKMSVLLSKFERVGKENMSDEEYKEFFILHQEWSRYRICFLKKLQEA